MSQKTTFLFNGTEYYFDVSDADCSEKLENATSKMEEDEKNAPKTGNASTIIKANCRLIKNYFEVIFGEGAGDALCGEKNILNDCYDAFDAFLDYVHTQNSELVERGSKYKQYSNRQQRRHPQSK